MKVEKLDHIHIYSKDPETSALFYLDHFEARELFRNENVYSQERIFLSLGGLLLAISPYPPSIEPSDPPKPGDGAYTHGFGVAHFGLKVNNVEDAANELRAAGVRLTSDPVHEATGLSYVYLEAPDGVIVELTQYGD